MHRHTCPVRQANGRTLPHVSRDRHGNPRSSLQRQCKRHQISCRPESNKLLLLSFFSAAQHTKRNSVIGVCFLRYQVLPMAITLLTLRRGVSIRYEKDLWRVRPARAASHVYSKSCGPRIASAIESSSHLTPGPPRTVEAPQLEPARVSDMTRITLCRLPDRLSRLSFGSLS